MQILMENSSGERLERFIRSRWTRDEGGIRGLADQAGISPDSLHRWFRGEEPGLDKLGRVASVLGVRRYELVAILDGDRPAADLQDLLDPALRTQLVDLIAAEIERLRDE